MIPDNRVDRLDDRATVIAHHVIAVVISVGNLIEISFPTLVDVDDVRDVVAPVRLLFVPVPSVWRRFLQRIPVLGVLEGLVELVGPVLARRERNRRSCSSTSIGRVPSSS